jgi:hypothetical protein
MSKIRKVYVVALVIALLSLLLTPQLAGACGKGSGPIPCDTETVPVQ